MLLTRNPCGCEASHSFGATADVSVGVIWLGWGRTSAYGMAFSANRKGPYETLSSARKQLSSPAFSEDVLAQGAPMTVKYVSETATAAATCDVRSRLAVEDHATAMRSSISIEHPKLLWTR